MDIQFEGNTYPIDKDDIECFESKYEIKLPNEYKNFLLNIMVECQRKEGFE